MMEQEVDAAKLDAAVSIISSPHQPKKTNSDRIKVTHSSPDERSFTGSLADLDLTKQTEAQMSIQPAANWLRRAHVSREASITQP